MIRRRHGGWSNDKPLAGARQLVGTVADDPVAMAATVAVSTGGLAAAIVIPQPGRVILPLAAAVAIGAGWRSRLGNRRVSYLVGRDQWEEHKQDVMSAYQVEVDVGRLAKAVDPGGTVHDVLVTCRRRDATAVGSALGWGPAPARQEGQALTSGATPTRT